MSIKYKLSLGISVLVLIVITVFYMIWKFNDNQYEYERLYRNAYQISEQVYNTSIVDGKINAEETMNMFNIIQTSNPFLIDMYFVDAQTGLPIVQTWNQESLAVLAKGSSFTKIPFQLDEVQADGTNYLVSVFQNVNNSAYQIKLIFNQKEVFKSLASHRLFLVECIYLVFFSFIVSLMFVSRLLSPLKDILWKVNEVSSVRFHKSIPITTRDEFGVLAFKINSMSQNLSIYMKKLKAAFDEKNRMRHQLESFIDHSTDAIYLLDIDGYITQINLAFQQLYGYKPQEVIGKQNVTVPIEYQAEKEQLIKQLKNGGVCLKPIDSIRVTKSGEEIPVSVTVTPIKDANNQITGFAVVSRDMRHRHQMEELIRRSEKLNTVGQLAAGVAHEIRNPLTTLKGFLQLQLRTQRFNQEHVEVMLSELDRINLIVSEFLILSKPQAVKFKCKDIRDIMSDVLAFMNSEAILHNVIFKTEYTNMMCKVECEENQLKQVFINLLKNAMEAMPNGGQVLIKVECNTQYVTCHINDEGVGIDAETLSRIGDPFFTAKENGTGLGMMVSQKIISSHNGTLDIKSQVNVGTTVMVSLPLYKSASLAEAINL